jgi:hypothetical protein
MEMKAQTSLIAVFTDDKKKGMQQNFHLTSRQILVWQLLDIF